MYIAAVQTSSLSNFLQLVNVFLIFLFVLGATYLTTRWVARYQKGHSFNKNLRIIETLKITANKYIQIVQAGDEYLVIAIGKDEVCLLTKLTEDQLEILPDNMSGSEIGTDSFKEILDKLKHHIPKK